MRFVLIASGIFSKTGFGPKNPATTTYAQGMTKSVRIAEIKSPPMTVIAIGLCISAPSAMPTASGKSPSTVVIVVMKIGLSRVLPDSITASTSSTPFARNLFIESIKIIPLLTTIPPRIIIPRITTTLTGVLVINNANNTPIAESGNVNIITNGCHNDSNCEAIII